MKKLIVVSMLVLAALLPLHPPCTLCIRKTNWFSGRNPGEWQNDKETWAFSKGDGAYKLVFSDEDEQAEFNVHLVRLGEHYFFDFYNIKTAVVTMMAVHCPIVATHSLPK